jgi:hypothetical protein
MVLSLRLLLLLGVLTVASARADLQLTPTLRETTLDGAKIKFLVFSDSDDSGKDITYGPPNGWEYSGSTSKFTLRPPGKAQAEGTITRISLDQPAVFDDATMKKLTAEALASVPEGSTNVTLVSQQKNPLLIGRKETFLVIVSYTLYGDNYQRSMMFLNRGKEQVRFRFVSRAVDFKDLQAAFQGSHFTWRNL